jgi:DNA polymerase III subunit beta
MKIQCDTEILMKGVQMVRNVIGTRRSVPTSLLTSVLVEAVAGAQDSLPLLELCATNLEISLQYRINDVTIDEPGRMLCPESKLAPILMEWPDGNIEITESKGICHINGKDSSFKISCGLPGDFPKMPEFNDKDFFEIDKTVLTDMIRKIAIIGVFQM